MEKETNNRMEVLAYIIADLKAENMMMTERVHQLVDDYNDVARQLRGKEKHEPNTEGFALGELIEALDKCEVLENENKLLKQQKVLLLKDRNEAKTHAADCDKLKRMNGELERFAKAIHSFVKDNKIYMKKGTSCGYKQGHPAVSSTACLECKSCLGIIEGCGVICEARLLEANVSFPKND